MGVKNLWRLLLPISRRISIQSLSHQTLAIDASIWLTQISKACRDPETGRLLPNRPHVRIFLLRLMRLLFHEIRPVIVFDGAMPEVKRREIQRRKDRREKLWRDDDSDGDGSGGALKRTAKKILVQRLKELKKKEAKMTGVKAVDEGSVSKQQSSSAASDGAFVSGFIPNDAGSDSEVTQQNISSAQDQSTEKEMKILNDSLTTGASNKDEQIIPIYSDQEIKLDDEDSENDWEMSHAVQSSINDSLTNQQSKFIREEPNIKLEMSNEVIASLPTITRSQWIDSRFREQRIQSRQECISVAGDMKEYSSTQLRNFLKGSRLNQRMNDIGALASQSAMQNDAGRTKAIFSANEFEPVSMKVMFGELDGDVNSSGTSQSGEDACGECILQSSDPGQMMSEDESGHMQTKNEFLLQESDDKNEKIDAVENTKTPIHIETHADESNGTNRCSTQQPKLIALASAGDEWAEWGKGSDSESEHQIKKSSILSSVNILDKNDDNTSSDEEGDITFLTLAGGNGKNSQKRVNRDTLSINDSNDDVESVDWEDGNSNTSEFVKDADKTSTDTTGFGNQIEIQEDNMFKSDVDFRASDISMNENELHDGSSSRVKTLNDESSTEQLNTLCGTKSQIQSSAIDQPKKIIDAQSDNDVCWEDGSSHAKGRDYLANDRSSEDDLCSNSHQVVDSDNETATDAKMIGTPVDDDISRKVLHTNEFDIPQPENPNIAALQHAQETALKLTNWAGRAVQRAFASHLQQCKESSPEYIKTKALEVELTRAESDADFSKDLSTNKAANASPDNGHEKGQFFDTSLEGLNAAHHAILEEEKLMERDMATITDEMKEDILKLLQLCGIPWIESPAEAEAQCAALEELGLVDGVVTEDSDIFVFGGRKVYKNFFNEQQYVEAYYARDVKKELGLGKNELVSLAMLLGGDYTDGVKGVGIVNGMEILQAFPVEDIRKGLQEFREWLDGFGDPMPSEDANDDKPAYDTKRTVFHKKHKSARTRWVAPADFPSQAIISAYTKPVVDKSDGKFSWAKPHIDGLQRFCYESLDWSQEETNRVLLPVLKVLEKNSKQRTLESYFMKYEDGIKFAEVRSKRLKTVLDCIQGEKHHEQTAMNNDVPSTEYNDETVLVPPAKKHKR